MRRARLSGVLTCLAAALLMLVVMRWEVERASARANSSSEAVRGANELSPTTASQAHSIYQAAQGSLTGTAPPVTLDSAPTPSRTAQRTPGGTTATTAPILTSTPRADGAVVHVVEAGQVLWNIAEAYKVSLTEIMALNNLTERSVIYPGNKLLIKPPEATPTITATETTSPTATVIPPSSTARPTRTLKAPDTATPEAAALSSTEGKTPDAQAGLRGDPLLILIGVLVLIGTGLVVAGYLLKREGKETNPPPP